MEKNNDHIIYSAADIKRYLDGKMQPLEMNAMEKAALEEAQDARLGADKRKAAA